ncbi:MULTISPECIES: phosphonate ABC transporter ATP-binding protein [unclassified Pseudodesulfovibrio]|uniref:phosphonate ABC transporter ATP-binding protein n=1 Tax=unclassified Pseudodesulfovibrio TaxID=2661612 RepID=UPI000FEB8FE1|nr:MULTISPECIES: phosphonate ABC transporter ATP-binding protein [unclassified Pseudodesulfovibrio]MCJ2163201.1 phosphonate ABC transporter ATP-binding protein [Pseudodesulfovibrio sp. S3-i]RWU07185.1 phosphonate ABC transporter ATP-binding protein [Pseudodesulfovibrio sp. S3]
MFKFNMPAGEHASAGRSIESCEIDVRGLSKSFGRNAVLNGVDLTVKKGEAVALVGSNGAGKSTLLRCLLRLIEPTEGSVQMGGAEVMALNRSHLRKLRSEVGFVFQKHNLVPRLSALTNVLHGAQSRKRGPRVWWHMLATAGERQEAMRCLQLVGLSHVAEQRVDRLSGGQSQRVAIARALMQRPRIMFADEPVASLDPNAGEEVMRLFVDLIRSRGLTLVYTSHSVRHALEYSDRVVGLRAGKVELDSRSSDLSADALRRIYG